MTKECRLDLSIREMVDIRCQAILEEEDMDIICGQPQISGKDAALMMEKQINEKQAEKFKRRKGQVAPIKKKM